MILKKVQITNFQSIRDSNEFEVGDITCLVGKNEAGKTSILKSLRRLNPIETEGAVFSVTDDFPRSEVEDYRHDVETKKREPANVVTATFYLDEEVEDIKSDLGNAALNNQTLILKRGYDNTLYITLNINEKEIIKHVVENYELLPELQAKLTAASNIKLAYSQLLLAEATEDVKKLQTLIKQIDTVGTAIYVYNTYVVSP